MDPRLEQWLRYRPTPRTQIQPVQPNDHTNNNNHIFRQEPQNNQWQPKKKPAIRKGCCGGSRT